ncbi:hypothetical protein L1887_39043 [Cichorium endivia]|nr:hypothetical protein L1887_39043 [Cichorium endivia]
MANELTSKLKSILGCLPVPPSVSEGAPGRGKVVQTKETDDLTIMDTIAGLSGSKEKNQEEGDAHEEDKAHANKGNESDKETTADQRKKPTEEEPILEETLEETPKMPNPPSPPKTQTPTIHLLIHTKDENLRFPPIKESDPLEIKARKNEYFDARAYLHAEDFDSDSDQGTVDPNKAGPSGPSKPDFSELFLFRPLTDSDFKPHNSYDPPPTLEYNWDIPLTPNGDKYVYTLNFSGFPKLNKELAIRYKNQKFLNKFTRLQVDTWSIEPITSVTSVKRRTFKKSNYYEHEIVRNHNHDNKILITKPDFRRMNPAGIYSIVMKLHSRAERHKDTKEAYLAARRFLHCLLEEFCTADGELFEFVKNHPDEQFQELVDLSMPNNRNNWRKGVTNDPMLGLVYKDPAIKGSLLFLRAEQIRRVPSAMLQKYIEAIKKSSHSDPKAKKEMLLRMEWMLAVRKFWSYAVKLGSLDRR